MAGRPTSSESVTPNGDQFEYAAEKLMLRYFRAIRRRMREEGISQTELAARLGVSQAYVSKLLKYNQNLTIRSLAELAEVLDVEWEQPCLVPKTTGICYRDFENPRCEQASVVAEPSIDEIAAEPAVPPVRRKRKNLADHNIRIL